MPAKKLIVALLIIFVAVGGFVAGLFLLRENQTLQEEAAVPGGQAEVSINPASGNFDLGQTITTNVFFNPANIPISGVAVRLTYPFSGATPEVTVSSIEINDALTSSGDWTCPTQTSTEQGGNVVIDIGCANQSASGFTANTDTLLAKVDLKVEKAPATQPMIIRFDPALSLITRKSDNQDILLIPTSTGSYTIGDVVQATPTLAPTQAASGSPSGTITKGGDTLPDAGIAYPTVFGLGLGIMVIVGALLLAI